MIQLVKQLQIDLDIAMETDSECRFVNPGNVTSSFYAYIINPPPPQKKLAICIYKNIFVEIIRK